MCLLEGEDDLIIWVVVEWWVLGCDVVGDFGCDFVCDDDVDDGLELLLFD